MFFDTAHEYLERLEKKDSFDPSQIDKFPYEEYHSNLKRYSQNEDWFTGAALDEFEDSLLGSDKVNKFPVKINPFQTSCFKHSYALFGETMNDERPLVIPKLVKESDSDNEIAEKGERILSKVWWENSGRSLQFINGLQAQIYGGCIFKASWSYFNKGLRQYPIVVESVHPKFFVGIPQSSNNFLLREAWVVKVISHGEANELGVQVEDHDVPWLVEHITPTTMISEINGKRVKLNVDGREKEIPDENPWGFVPIVYIPHLRASGFYGINLIDNAIGLVKELNLRTADFGDAISVDSHGLIGMRNITGTPKVVPIVKGRFGLNLGSSLAGMAEKGQPDAFDLGRVYASQSMKDINDLLYEHIRRALYVPAVADGEDEGSQRSALTLYVRMWPLIQHTNTERIHWTDGLNLFSRMMLKMLATDTKKTEVTEEMTKLLIKQQWAPVLPRDREVLVNEVVQRIATNLGSPELLLEMLGDVEDPEAELKRIKEWMKYVAENTVATNSFGNDPNESSSANQPQKKDKEIKSNG